MTISGVARRTVQQWAAKYNRGSVRELFDKPRSGQPTKLPRDREEKFRRRIQSGPTADDGVSVLNGPAIRGLVPGRSSAWAAGHVDSRLGSARFASAGHPPIQVRMVVRAGGGSSANRPERRPAVALDQYRDYEPECRLPSPSINTEIMNQSVGCRRPRSIPRL